MASILSLDTHAPPRLAAELGRKDSGRHLMAPLGNKSCRDRQSFCASQFGSHNGRAGAISANVDRRLCQATIH
jgi:hypothetical protein